MRPRSLIQRLLLAAGVIAAVTAVVAGDDLVIPLKFIPTTNPSKIYPTLREGISNKPFALVIDDTRQVKTRDLIGEGTGFKDEPFRIRHAGHLPSYLKKTLSDRFGAWGFQTDEHASLVLAIKVTRFNVNERHAFYGSQFTAEVQLPWTLMDRAGNVFSSGTALGAGRTKGRWRNPVNCEEVLADALQQAAVTVANDAKLQDAWITAVPQRPAPVIAAAPAAPKATASTKASAKTPAQLLAEVNKLRKQQMGTRLIVDFISKQTLASAFSANDLVAWKKAGIPEPVMQAALRRAP